MRKKSRFPIIPGPYWGALPFRRKVGAEHELHDRFLIPRPKIDRETTATHVECTMRQGNSTGIFRQRVCDMKELIPFDENHDREFLAQTAD